MAFLSEQELADLGLGYVGKNVKLSSKASIYNPKNVFIEDNSRIDDFCVLSAGTRGIHIGRFVHIAVGCSLIGEERITVSDFSGMSSRVSLYSSSDDYSGEFMTNPTVPSNFTNVISAPVLLNRHSIVGAGSIILPGVTMEIAAATGALTVVRKDIGPFEIHVGNPAKKIGLRKKTLMDLELAVLQYSKQ